MRSAFTLAELVVALAVGGVAFGTFAAIVRQQEQTHANLAHRMRARAQAIEGLAALLLELRTVAPVSGDIPPGAARDSAIEFRAGVGTFSVCAVRNRSIVTALGSFLSAPKTGDTAWALVAGDSADWRPLAVTAIATVPDNETTGCTLPVLAPGSIARRERRIQRYLLELGLPAADSIGEGTPVRLSRRVRYSLYRAPDGRWYLGRREFSATLGRFETIQPVSGPYAAYGPVDQATAGLELRYFDRTGAEIENGAVTTDRIARVDVTVRTPPPPGLPSHGRRDVTSIGVALRNAR